MSAAHELVETLERRAERNRALRAMAEEESTFVRLAYAVWIEATEEALRDVRRLLPAIEEEAVDAAANKWAVAP